MNDDFIYLDHAATTPVSEKVLAAMMPYFSTKFFNPSAPYFPAIEVRRDYEDAKHQIAQNIGGKSDELVMTAGATESINLAFSAASKSAGDEILVAEFEHHAVLAASEKFGISKKIKISKNSVVDLADLREKINPQTKIVSVMLANNETGVIQPISKIAEMVREERLRRLKNGDTNPIWLHTDASQGVGQIDISVARLGVDMLTLNAGKIYGPKQTGLLWANREVVFDAQIVGGGQERNLRSGTENVPSVIGFAKALQLAEKHRKSEVKRLQGLKEIFEKSFREHFEEGKDFFFLGNSKKQLASHISVSFPGIDAERIVFALENQGVLVATGSACAANKGTRSHTLVAMNLSDEEADGSLRISLGALSNEENSQRAAEIISKTIRAEFERIKV
ncbi:MAG: cysteine desulfurase family protein [bacterium]|nr:cysteine desulfurase family protein [bacterium]